MRTRSRDRDFLRQNHSFCLVLCHPRQDKTPSTQLERIRGVWDLSEGLQISVLKFVSVWGWRKWGFFCRCCFYLFLFFFFFSLSSSYCPLIIDMDSQVYMPSRAVLSNSCRGLYRARSTGVSGQWPGTLPKHIVAGPAISAESVCSA